MGVAEAPTPGPTVAVGEHFTCALMPSGAVRCWGDGSWGQLGRGDQRDIGDGPGEMGVALDGVPLGTGRTATELSAGSMHACALLDDASVRCWGGNDGGGPYAGQLGLGDRLARGDGPGEMGDALPAVDLGTGRTATAIGAGSFHTCALLDDGSVRCWGASATGQLGRGTVDTIGDEPGEMGDALVAVDLGTGRTATQLAVGGSFACAILDDDTTRCWGENENSGQLGLGDLENRGDQPGEMGDALPALDFGPGRTAVRITAGQEHACAILDDGSLRCWGNGFSGALGLGDTEHRGDEPGEMGAALPAVDLGPGRTAVDVAAGPAHTCAVLDDGTLRCWGYNGVGSTGLGTTETKGDEPGEMGAALPPVDLGTEEAVVDVATRGMHTCATLHDGTVRCWGQNEAGKLGLGHLADIGDEPGEMGAALPAVDLTPHVPHPSLLLAGPALVELGETIEYTATVTNHAPIVLTGVSLTFSDTDPTCDAFPTTLAPGQTVQVTCTFTPWIEDAMTVRTNVATIDSDQTLPITSNGVSTYVAVGGPEIQLSGPPTALIGDRAWFAAIVTNVAPLALTDLFTIGDVWCTLPDTLAVGETIGVTCALDAQESQLGTYEAQVSLGHSSGFANSDVVEVEVGYEPPTLVLSGPETAEVGEQVEYSVEVTNEAPVAMTGMSLSEDDADCETLLSALASGATVAVDCTHTMQVADVGTYSNVVTMDSVQTWPVASNEVDTLVAGVLAPTVVKSGPSEAQVGEELEYEVEVTNEALVDLTGVTLDDPNADCEELPSTIEAGEDESVDCTHTAVAEDVGTYSNVATVESNEAAPTASNQVDTVVSGIPAPTVEKSGPAAAEVGDELEYEVEVTNEAAIDLTGVTLDDPNADCEDLPSTIEAGEDESVDCTHTAVAEDVGTYSNVATFSSDESGPVDSNQVDTVVSQAPEPTVVKSGPATAEAGDELAYTVEVTNEAVVDLTGVTLTDNNADCDPLPSTIDAGDTESVDCTYTSRLSDVGTYSNTANVDSDQTDAVGSNRVDTTVTPPAGDPEPPTVLKTGDADAQVAGGPIEYQVTLTNQAGIPLTGVTLSDPNATCDPMPAGVGPGGQASVSCTHLPVAADVGTYTNVATVDTDQFDPVASNPVHTTVTAMATNQRPTVSLTGPATATVGDELEYAVTVVNNASSTLTGITLADPNADCEALPTSMVAGQTRSVDCTHLTTSDDIGTYSNVATFASVQSGPIASNQVDTTVSPVPSAFADVPWDHRFFADVEWMSEQGISQGYADGTYRPTAPVSRQAMSAFLYRMAGSPAFVDPAVASFSDVGAAHPFFHEVEWMAAAGITEGFDGNRFRPADAVSRQAMSAFLHRMAGSPAFAAPTSPSFSDVGADHPFFHEVEWMAAEGISEGFDDGTFRPGTAVSRQAMSAFLHRLADGPGVDLG
jgi:uncharacterized repeat protein (TIGR01451 family)